MKTIFQRIKENPIFSSETGAGIVEFVAGAIILIIGIYIIIVLIKELIIPLIFGN